MSLLVVDSLVKHFGRRRVVDKVSFHVGQGEVVGLLGRNGAGKTTTFRMTVGMLKPDSGSVLFGDTDVSQLPMYRRARLGMGYLAQEPSVFRRLTVLENIVAILETLPKRVSDRKAAARGYLTRFGLGHLEQSLAQDLSGGERRRLEITRALVTEPRLLLLDEPFSGVDPIAVGELQGMIRGLKQAGVSILLTDHNVRETLAITDRSYIIDAGRVEVEGVPQDIVNSEFARNHYLGQDFKL